MAGIFETPEMRGSSLSGESFIQQPVEKVSAQAVGALAQAGTEIYGSIQVDKAEKRIGDIQNQFLDDLSQTRKDISQIEQEKSLQEAIDEANPAETAAFRSSEARIKTLQEAIANRRINPTEAMSRIEAEKRRALNHAPMFANEIRALTGSRGTTFDAETTQLIKETNLLREAVKKAGGNPDNPSHIDMVRKKQSLEFEAEFLAAQGKLEGVRADRILSDALSNNMQFQESVINERIQQVGGTANLSSTDISEAIADLEQFRNGGEVNVVRQMIDNIPGIDYALVAKESPDTIKRAEAQVRGQAEVLIKRINGSIPESVLETQVNIAGNEVLLGFQSSDPVGFHLLMLAGKMPRGSVGEFAVSNLAGARVADYSKRLYEGDLTGTTQSYLDSQGVDGKKVQKVVASNMAETRDWLKKNSDKVDPQFAKKYADMTMNTMDALTLQPQEYHPSVFDGLLEDMASPEINEIISKLGPTELPTFIEKSGRAVRSYVNERLVPDMAKQLDKGIFLSGADGKVALKDVVTATVAGGTFQFVPNTGFEKEIDNARAFHEAKKLNEMYGPRIQATIRALKQTQLLTDDQVQDYVVSTYQRPLAQVGENLSSTPDVVTSMEGKKTLIGIAKDVREAVTNPQETLNRIKKEIQESTELDEIISKLPPSLKSFIEGEGGNG